jgi:NAD(P)H-dependent flavin oxidoreductase YrpB (nitropropane dioxygenase family)
VTTEECDVHPSFKQAYLECAGGGFGGHQEPGGHAGKSYPNAVHRPGEDGRIPPEKCNRCLIPCKSEGSAILYHTGADQRCKGDVEHGLVFAGSNAYRATKIEKG